MSDRDGAMAEQADARLTPKGLPMAGTRAEKPADAGSIPADTTPPQSIKACALLAIEATLRLGLTLSPLMTAIFEAIRAVPDDDKTFRAAHALDDFARSRISRSHDRHFNGMAALDYDSTWEGDWYVSNQDLETFGTFTMWLSRYVPKHYPDETLTAGIRRGMRVMRMKQAYDRFQKSGVTMDHLTLAEKAIWQIDTMRGDGVSIYVQGKRPFGNSGVAGDIFRVLEWDQPWPDEECIPEDQAERAWNIFDELVFALPEIAKLAKLQIGTTDVMKSYQP